MAALVIHHVSLGFEPFTANTAIEGCLILVNSLMDLKVLNFTKALTATLYRAFE
jgi:hypothetical protein